MELGKALIKMLMSSISDVDRCYYKWVVAVDLEVPNGSGSALGTQKSMIFGLIVTAGVDTNCPYCPPHLLLPAGSVLYCST
jgi:hypothetical protein